MPPTGTLITDVDFGPVIEDDYGHLTGLRHYRVDTHDEGAARDAAGVPKIEDPWSATLPALTCRRLSTEYIGGTDDATTGVGGWTRVRAEYSNYIDVRPLPRVGNKYTELQSRVSSVPIMRDVRPGPEFQTHIIENGRGTQREVGGVIARVTAWPGQYSAAAILTAINYQARQFVNDGPITLPPVLRTSLSLTLAARQARYHDFDVGMEAGLLRVTHTLILSPDAASWFWWTQGPEGVPIDPRESRIYEEASFAGLW